MIKVKPGSISGNRVSLAVRAVLVSLSLSRRLTRRPEGVGNLGNFIYVGTTTGQIYITQERRRQRRVEQLAQCLARPRRLAGRADHHRPHPGQPRRLRRHRTGVYTTSRIRPARRTTHQHGRRWINITGNIHNLALYDPRPVLRPDDRPERDQVQSLTGLTRSSLTGGTRSPTTPLFPPAGYHPALFIAQTPVCTCQPIMVSRGLPSRIQPLVQSRPRGISLMSM